MNEDINESAADQGALSVREAARKLLADLDQIPHLASAIVRVDSGLPVEVVESQERLKQALKAQRSNMPAIPGVELAAEGVELIKSAGPVSTDHVRAIVEAAEWAFEAAAVFELRWDADMRAIKLWQAAGEGRDLIWPDHADLTLWLLELVEHQPPCPSINDVAALIGDLRKFAASVLMQRAADQLEQMANALVASSRRTVAAESNVQIVPQLIVAWLRSQDERPGKAPSRLNAYARHFADAIEAGEWLPLRGAAIRAERGARPALQLVEGGGGAAAGGQAFAYRVGVCRICGCTENSACMVPEGENGSGACSWADATHTLCDNPSCVEQAGVDGARAAYEDGPAEVGSACEEPIAYDSLRVVFGRPDVQEAIAKAVAAQRGADWQEATEAGRNAFREEAAGLLRVAVAQPQ